MRRSLAAVLIAAFAATAHGPAEGGTVGRRTFDVGPFSAVSLQAAPDVVVSVGGAPSVWAEGDTDRLAALDIEVQGQTLRIDTRRGARWRGGRGRAPVIVHVQTPQLSSAAVGGSGNMRIERLEGASFSGRVDGSGNLQIPTLSVGEAVLAVSGSGNIVAAGNASRLRASSSGSGNASLAGLSARQATISVSGSGNIQANVNGIADVRVSGSGGATVTGGARCNVQKIGSGDARCS